MSSVEKIKLFLTGASGFIGGRFLHHLDFERYAVTALLRRKSSFLKEFPQIQVIEGDLMQPHTYESHLKEQEIVLHFAALYRIGVVNRRKMYAINVEGTKNLMDRAFADGIQKFIHISSTAALGETLGKEADETARHNGIFRSYYEETKHIAHGLVLNRIEAGKPGILVVPGGVFGLGDPGILYQTIRDYSRGKIPFQVETTSRFNLTHVDPICQGILLVLEKGKLGDSYILAEKNISMEEIFALLANYAGKTPLKKVKPQKLRKVAKVLDTISKVTPFSFPLSQEALQIMDGSTYTYSSQKAKQELGWAPTSFLDDFLAYLKSPIFSFTPSPT